MSSTIEVIKPVVEDIPELLQLLQETTHLHYRLDASYYVPWDESLRDRLEAYVTSAIVRNDPMILGARDGDQWVGLILYEINSSDPIDSHFKRCGEVLEFVVTEGARGRGIGKELLNQVERFFVQEGVSHFKLFCSSNNPKAHAFYEREGYTSSQQLFCKTLEP